MEFEVAGFQPSTGTNKLKEGSFGSNNSNEPISVLDTRRSPSPSTSTSTLSSSFGGAGNGCTTTTAATMLGISNDKDNHNVQQQWLDSVPPDMGGVGGVGNNGATAEGGRKDEWPELQPIPAEFELQQQRFGVGLEDWDRLLSESGACPVQDQSLRWISGDFDDTSLSQADQIAPPAVSDTLTSPKFFPFSISEHNSLNQQMILTPNPQPPQVQFHHQVKALISVPRFQKAPVSVQDLQKVPNSVQGFQKDPVCIRGIQKAPFFHQNLRKFPDSNLGFQKVTNFNQDLQKVPIFHQSHELLCKKPSMATGTRQEPPQTAIAPPPHHHYHHDQHICDQLFAAAELMLSGNFSHAQGILARLNHQFSSAPEPTPKKPFQRAASYFKEAMQMQIQSLTSGSDSILKQFNGMLKMGAYKIFSEVSPIIQFMNFTSNQTLLEALGDARNIHIIDFDIGFGAQWASFLQELPTKNNNGCSLKITAFASPSTHHPIELGLMHDNLSQFAQEIGISFELEVVNFDTFDPRSFSVPCDETIAVNFPIWSASSHLSAIPSILHFVKMLSPRIVVSHDRGCERMDLPFPHYILQGLQYYEVLLDSIDGANVAADISNKIERFLLQPQIERMVLGKFQNPEPMPHWKSLFAAAGYSKVLLSDFAETQADCVAKRMQVQGFHIEKRQESLFLCWQNRELMMASAWKC